MHVLPIMMIGYEMQANNTAGGHSGCYQGMANEEPASKVPKTYLQ